MVNRCVVGGCSNTPVMSADRVVCLHNFPDKKKNLHLFEAWTAFVRQKREGFQPTKSSCICSQHFTDHCFTNKMKVMIMANNPSPTTFTLRLRPDAIPSVNDIESLGATAAPSKRQKRTDSRIVRQLVEDTTSASVPESVDSDEYDSDDISYDSPEELEVDDCIDDPTDPLWTPEAEEEEEEHEMSLYWTELCKDLNFSCPAKETKFIVHASNLFSVLRVCSTCDAKGDEVKVVKSTNSGAVLLVQLLCCKCGKEWKWQSLGSSSTSTKVENSQLTAAILFTGCIPSKVIRYMKANNIAFPARNLYFKNQRQLHNRVVSKVWENKRLEAIEESRSNGAIHCGGDARCDSMGFCAQFGSYTFLDLNTRKILDMQPISRVETKMNSVAMELEGLKRGLAKLRALEVEIQSVVTDRHVGIAKHMEQCEKDISHYYDCWHVNKSITKQLKTIGKRACNSEELNSSRITSITNRLYRMAQTTTPGPTYSKVMDEKRVAMLRHLVGYHVHPDNTVYKSCTHRGALRKRMDPEKEAYREVQKLCTKPHIRKAICKLSPVGQTSRVESYHHVVLSFAPKNLSFGYPGMVSRLLLAAIHYNENCQNEMLTDEHGDTRLRVSYTKWRGGSGTTRAIRKSTTYNYLEELMVLNYECGTSQEVRETLPTIVVEPPTMTSQLDREPRERVIERHRARFSIM